MANAGYSLHSGAGPHQRILLNELEGLAVIVQNRETGLWQRGALETLKAKDLLTKDDKTLNEQVEYWRKVYVYLTTDAIRISAGRASGEVAWKKLVCLRSQKKFLYEERLRRAQAEAVRTR